MPRVRSQLSDRESFDHTRLEVYQLATQFFRLAYQLSQRIRREDSFLKYQFLRAALSIKTNIAEGSGEFRPKEKARFYRIARRSAHEAASLLEDIEFLLKLTKAECDPLYSMLRRLITMLIHLGRGMEERERSRASNPKRNKRAR